jgi:hypothetical protein
MTAVDPRLVSALREQLWRRPSNAHRVGWKVGRGDRERIGDEIAVGHLTSATVLRSGGVYADGARLHADAEIALELGDGQAISGYGASLEIVDLELAGDAQAVVESNIFHRAVAFGPIVGTLPTPIDAKLVVNGLVRAAAPVVEDFAATLLKVARILGAAGETLRAGDRVITGSVVQVPIAAGDDVVADFGALGRVQVAIA